MRGFGILWLMLLLASGALAQPGPAISVTRAAGADDCPDTAALLARIELLRGRPDAGATVAYHVEFTREPAGFRAEIRAGSGGENTRSLHDRAITCAGLEQATAVTLALLLDSDARASSTPALIPERDAANKNAPAPRAVAKAGEPNTGDELEITDPQTSGSARGRRSATVALGPAALFGVLRPIAPALALELGVRLGSYRAAIGLLWSPGRARELAPGTVRESLWSGSARACVAPVLGRALRLDVCTGMYLGSLHASAQGYDQNRAVSRLWLALPVELALASTPAPIGWELSGSALFPVRRQDFAIDRAGVAYASLPVGVLVSLRGVGLWEW
jgi:hypothetical protein